MASYFNDQLSSNCTGKWVVRGHLRVMLRGSAEKFKTLLQQAQVSTGAQMGSRRCVWKSFSRIKFCLYLSRTSLNLVKRFSAARNLLMGPGLVGSAFLISSADIAVHLSSGICVTHWICTVTQLFAMSSLSVRICWISFSTESRDRPLIRQGLAHKNFCFKSNCFTKVSRCDSKNLWINIRSHTSFNPNFLYVIGCINKIPFRNEKQGIRECSLIGKGFQPFCLRIIRKSQSMQFRILLLCLKQKKWVLLIYRRPYQ